MSWWTPELQAIVWSIAKSLIILLGVVSISAMLIWVERRLLGMWQDRWGPNRVGPFGLGQVAADMIKIFFKEDWTPSFVDKPVFWIAPLIALVVMLLSFAIIPITDTWVVADLNIGILYFLAVASLAVYAIMLGGWSSNSKYSLLGGLRSAAQMITYEVFMGIAVMGVVMEAGSFNLRDIVAAQVQQGWFITPILHQFVGFWLFFTAAIAVTHRSPFDLPEAEQELVAGFHTEYSGMKFGMFFVGEYVGVLMVSALVSVLYFGGWLAPSITLGGHRYVLFGDSAIWLFAKTAVFVYIFILIRAALPRPRYDHMMTAGWMFMLPVALINLMLTGAKVLAFHQP